jgi:hypothetical protein
MELMYKKIVFAAVLVVVFAQAGFAQKAIGSKMIDTTSKLELFENYIWILDKNDAPLSNTDGQIFLYIDSTNPTFFALVYNTIKDHLREKRTACYVWTTKVTDTHGTYGKITQIQIRSK